MPFVPSFELEDAPGELLRYAISPISLPFTLALAMYDYMEGTDHSDLGENIRNTGIWGAQAIGIYAYNSYMFPGQFEFRTAQEGYSLFAHSRYASPAARLGGRLVTGAAAAYVTTSLIEDVVGQTIDVAQGRPSKPWWMPLAVYHALYS